jgi:hypothetical protein
MLDLKIDTEFKNRYGFINKDKGADSGRKNT